MNITVFSEHGTRYTQEKEIVAQHPQGIHETLRGIFAGAGFSAVSVYQTENENGTERLTDEVLNNTDVLVWWGHIYHGKISDELVEKIFNRVMGGMGCIFLHSAHMAKPFRRLMGTGCTLKWREAGERERLWVTAPAHPIAEGIPEHFELEHEEMYGEYFDVPKPDDVVFTGWFQGGEVFRSGLTYTRGKGKVFYFQPGHETYATYKNENVCKILVNAAKWAAPAVPVGEPDTCPNVEPLEKI